MTPFVFVVLAVSALGFAGGLIYFLDLAPSARTAELRGIIDELDKLTANGAGQMVWRMAQAREIGSERNLNYDLVYTWQNTDVKIELTVQQRRKVSGLIVLTLGEKPMPTWHYGPKGLRKLTDLLPDLRQILGENEIKVVASPAA